MLVKFKGEQMKKSELKKLALLGLSTGVLLTSQNAFAAEADLSPTSSKEEIEKDYHLMSDAELREKLDANGLKLYDSLDAEGKALARSVASQRCQGMNACKGLNSCKTDTHACQGQGTCKAKGKCVVLNKNDAVKMVHDKVMKEKRSKLSQ